MDLTDKGQNTSNESSESTPARDESANWRARAHTGSLPTSLSFQVTYLLASDFASVPRRGQVEKPRASAQPILVTYP